MQRPGGLVGSAWAEALPDVCQEGQMWQRLFFSCPLFLKCLICFTEQYVLVFSYGKFFIEKNSVDKYFLYILYVYIKFFGLEILFLKVSLFYFE